MNNLIFSFKDKKIQKIKNPKNILGGKGANLAELSKEGYKLKKIINYRSEMITEINQENKKLLEQFPPDLIYIYSARSAESFIGLAKNYNLIPLMTHSTIMCISEKVAKIFKSLGWKKIEIFNPGDEMAKL